MSRNSVNNFIKPEIPVTVLQPNCFKAKNPTFGPDFFINNLDNLDRFFGYSWYKNQAA